MTKEKDKKITIFALSNGIRVVHRRTLSQIAYTGVMVGAGTRDEQDKEDGMAHFIEHTVFKGTQKRSARQLIDRIENVGGELNAYTTKEENDDETTGIRIIERAIEEPLRQIAANAGVEASVIINKIREGKGDFGYNARTDEYVKMYQAGIIDPTKVARVALENAASVAGMLLTTECGIVDIPEPAPAAPAMPAGGMM